LDFSTWVPGAVIAYLGIQAAAKVIVHMAKKANGGTDYKLRQDTRDELRGLRKDNRKVYETLIDIIKSGRRIDFDD